MDQSLRLFNFQYLFHARRELAVAEPLDGAPGRACRRWLVSAVSPRPPGRVGIGVRHSTADAVRFWNRLADPGLRAQERLFFELYSQALLARRGTEGFLEEALEGWISPVARSFINTALDEHTARDLARLGLAVTRGLLLDLLASGDTEATTDAYELFTRLLGQAPRLESPGGLRSNVT